jgi:hypothetical protein
MRPDKQERARMRFYSARNPQEQGEAVLWADGTFQILPSAGLDTAIRRLARSPRRASAPTTPVAPAAPKRA